MRSGMLLSLIAAIGCASPAWCAGKTQEKPAATMQDWLSPWIRHDTFRAVKLSPDGQYFAASVMTSEDTGMLVFLRRSDLKITGKVQVRGRTSVSRIYWVNNERVLFTIAEAFGSKEAPGGTGEVYASNVDGKKSALLAGGRDGKDPAFVYLLDDEPDADNAVLISRHRYSGGEHGSTTVERMDIYSGRSRQIAKSPVDHAQFFVDHQSRVRLATGFGDDNRQLVYVRADNSSEWTLLNDEHTTHHKLAIHGFDRDGSHAYIESEEDDGPNGLYAVDLATQNRTLVARDPRVDPAILFFDHSDRDLLAVSFMDGRPKLSFVDDDAPDAKRLQTLMQAFPGEWVTPTSYTKDGSEMVFEVSGDVSPPRFYLLGRDGKATFVLGARDWIDPDKMAEMKPVLIQTRDGLELMGYLTVPPGSDGKNLPLVVHPHGGPFGIADDWSFDPEVQMLASRGYAVLQVNYRGSGNRGRAFEVAGAKEWGGKMQDDLTDATHWAIDQGVADRDRICIFGASYGGYASGMGVAKEPDLYKCAVGYVGLYDLALWYKAGDVHQRKTGVSYLRESVGSGDELDGRSPALLADRIKVPVFLAAGGEDERCPAVQSEHFRDALQKAGVPVEYMFAPHEGHGFYREEVNRELYTRMIAFLDKHIGPGK